MATLKSEMPIPDLKTKVNTEKEAKNVTRCLMEANV